MIHPDEGTFVVNLQGSLELLASLFSKYMLLVQAGGELFWSPFSKASQFRNKSLSSVLLWSLSRSELMEMIFLTCAMSIQIRQTRLG